MIKVLEKEIQHEILLFTNRKAIYWSREKALIISDLHVGKSAHFRRSGIAVPSQILLDDLEVLEKLISHFTVEKLIIVGDLFHAGYNSDLDIFCTWREKFNRIEIILIKGNHDRVPKKFYDDNCISTIDTILEISPFTFVHEPEIKDGSFTVSGHIHPGVVLAGRGRQIIKLPCYAVSASQIILPAFSKFTGLDTKTLNTGFRNIAFTEGTIFDY